MLVLVVAILYGFVFAYFATQNTLQVTLTLGNFVFTGVPLYLIALGSLLMGTLLALVINLIESVPTNLALRDNETRIIDANQTIENQTKRIHALEMENLQLKDSEPRVITYSDQVQTITPKRSVWDKLKENFRTKHNQTEDYGHV